MAQASDSPSWTIAPSGPTASSASLPGGVLAGRLDDEAEAARGGFFGEVVDRAERGGEGGAVGGRVDDMDRAEAYAGQHDDGAEPDRAGAEHERRAAFNDPPGEPDAVRGGADRVEEERREPVGDVVRHRQEAALRDGKPFGIAARRAASRQDRGSPGRRCVRPAVHSSQRPQKTGM